MAKHNPSARFGRRVRALREAAGFSQEAFALRAGIDRSYYSVIERGRANVCLDTIAKIARALGVETAELFS
jgi:transcriptional regulator with XRE-family HTH domain